VAEAKQRIAFIDWIRGLACIGMFEWHGYDSWLRESARHGKFFRVIQLGGTLPAPIFLFSSGISLALVVGLALQKGATAAQAGRRAIRRGAEIFGFGLLFRVQEFLLGQPRAPWTDLLRVDILNIIGVAIMLMGLLCWAAGLGASDAGEIAGRGDATSREDAAPRALPRKRYVIWSAAIAAAIVLATPPLWTTHQPRWLPWPLESYLNGVHNLGVPQPWLFPIFPWVAFAFAGLAAGFLLFSPWARAHEAGAFALAGAGGGLLFALGEWLDAGRVQLYAVYDFWHTSPNFFLMRTGALLGIVFGAYAWCRWGATLKVFKGFGGFSPVIEMGRTSLFVYWAHIEFVYGRFSIQGKREQSVLSATAGIVIISAAMVLLATVRNRMKGRGLRSLAFWRRAEGVPA
jgi:uncharacterized membrane protein